MGVFSPFVNAWACIWTFFVTIIFLLPTVRPVAPDTMNYASVFIAFILVCSTIFWYTNGKKFYTGPIIEAQVDEDSQSDHIVASIEKKGAQEMSV